MLLTNRILGAIAWLFTSAAVLSAQIPGDPTFGIPGLDAKVTAEAKFSDAARPGEIATLEVAVSIQPGWHIYGSKESAGPPTRLKVAEVGALQVHGKPVLPEGEPHTVFDETSYWISGDVVLRQSFVVPEGTAPGEIQVTGQLDFMACTETFCDPPGSESFAAALVVEAGAVRPERIAPKPQEKLKQEPESAGLSAFGAVPGLEARVFLKARFVDVARPGEVAKLRLEASIEPGWHIYRDDEPSSEPTKLEIEDPGQLQVWGDAVFPEGEPHEVFGETSHWIMGDAVFEQEFVVPEGATPGEFEVSGLFSYMACTEEFCDDATADSFDAVLTVEAGAARPGRLASESTPVAKPSDDEDLGTMSLGVFLMLAVGWGLFALAMPCTYPMIPITISFFTKQADARGGRVLPLALAYGFGIVAIFIVIGVLVGPPIAVFAAHPTTNLVIAVLFLVFALSLFGLINLQPPKFLMNAASQASAKGGYAGVFLMGATLVITSFTCTAPFVGSLLAVGADGGDLGRVILGMAVFGLTMAVPFVFLSLVPGKLQALPRSGEWMNVLKVFLGFVEVAAALKFLSNVDLVLQWGFLSRELFLWLWAGIFGLSSVYLLGMIKLKGETGDIGPGRLVSALLVMLMGLYFAYGASGNRLDWVTNSIIPPYSNRVAGVGGGAHDDAVASRIIVKDDYDGALAIAKEKGLKLFVNFTGVT